MTNSTTTFLVKQSNIVKHNIFLFWCLAPQNSAKVEPSKNHATPQLGKSEKASSDVEIFSFDLGSVKTSPWKPPAGAGSLPCYTSCLSQALVKSPCWHWFHCRFPQGTHEDQNLPVHSAPSTRLALTKSVHKPYQPVHKRIPTRIFWNLTESGDCQMNQRLSST